MQPDTQMTLEDYLQKHGAMPFGDALPIIRELTAALAVLHERGMVHRNITPASVMLTWEHRGVKVSLLDAGTTVPMQDIKHEDMVAGNVLYAAPEQFKGTGTCQRADLYALGVMIFELLAGKPPFRGNAPQVITAHLNQPPPPLLDCMEMIPRRVNDAVLRLMAKNPDDRFASANEFLDVLSKLCR